MFVERLRAFPRHGLYHQAPERIGIKTAMTHLLDELRVFRLCQDLLNREWALHPRCNARRRTQCPVFSSGASAELGLVRAAEFRLVFRVLGRGGLVSFDSVQTLVLDEPNSEPGGLRQNRNLFGKVSNLLRASRSGAKEVPLVVTAHRTGVVEGQAEDFDAEGKAVSVPPAVHRGRAGWAITITSGGGPWRFSSFGQSQIGNVQGIPMEEVFEKAKRILGR